MIEETGRVIRVDQNTVWVSSVRSNACESCSARKGCGQAVLAEAASKTVELELKRPQDMDIHCDDQVVVGIEESSFLQATLLVYLLPIGLLLIGGGVGHSLGGELGSISGAGIGFSLGLLCSKIFGNRIAPSCRYQPEILKVVSNRSEGLV